MAKASLTATEWFTSEINKKWLLAEKILCIYRTHMYNLDSITAIADFVLKSGFIFTCIYQLVWSNKSQVRQTYQPFMSCNVDSCWRGTWVTLQRGQREARSHTLTHSHQLLLTSLQMMCICKVFFLLWQQSSLLPANCCINSGG